MKATSGSSALQKVPTNASGFICICIEPMSPMPGIISAIMAIMDSSIGIGSGLPYHCSRSPRSSSFSAC
jgi:hypothetical protein